MCVCVCVCASVCHDLACAHVVLEISQCNVCNASSPVGIRCCSIYPHRKHIRTQHACHQMVSRLLQMDVCLKKWQGIYTVCAFL